VLLLQTTVLLCALGAKPSFDPTGPYKVDYEGLKILLMSPRLKELSILSLFLLYFPTFPSIELILADFSLEEASRGVYPKKRSYYTIVRPGV